MCGIAGLILWNDDKKHWKTNFPNALASMQSRGPDNQDVFEHEKVQLGHRRLSILDLNPRSNQPFHSKDGKYTIVFNGEIFNYAELKNGLISEGVSFDTTSDTEVLLHLFIRKRETCLNLLNGFFAFAIYLHDEKKLFIARDRFGVKPLIYQYTPNGFLFSSELKFILNLHQENVVNKDALNFYFSLGYIPAPHSILKNTSKLLPGNFLWVDIENKNVEVKEYYDFPQEIDTTISYEDATTQLKALIDDAVKLRLLADVNVGAFLSGGVDSSIICASAVNQTKQLNTYSIGFPEMEYLDETKYAELVAQRLGTNHTTFALTENDMINEVENVLNYIDEPFADSSALAVYVLCKHTSVNVKVALSGDAGDELFAGYRKHRAYWLTQQNSIKLKGVRAVYPFVKNLSSSRQSKLGDTIRKLKKMAEVANASEENRYWKLASFLDEDKIHFLKHKKKISDVYQFKKTNQTGMNAFLLKDFQCILPNDMLHKVDMMSMAHSLEVRVPALDYRVVNFAMSLPEEYKIDKTSAKKIWWNTYQHILPAEVYHRPKKGFEVPLEKWMKGSFHSLLLEYTSTNWHPNLFTDKYLNLIQTHQPQWQDWAFQAWSMLVFQFWMKKYNLQAEA